MSHCLPSPPPKPAAPTFQIAASSKQTQLITGPSLAVGTFCFSRTAVILNNLYGVDIMEEATEICKLRLFLKLVAQVDPGETIEPLPDIDFNIRAGNTLVGFASEKELGRILGSTFDFDNTIKGIEERAEEADFAYKRFREMQVKYSADDEEFRKSKLEVESRLEALRDELDAYLAGDYGVRKTDAERFTLWRRNYHPFHWLVEFYGIMKSGGFEVIIGNPPYAELRSVSRYTLKRFSTLATKNLYSVMLERCTTLFADDGRIGMIVPVSSISTEGYKPLQDIEFKYDGFFSSYDDRPSRLFDGLEHIRLSIHLLQNRRNTNPQHFSTEYLRWSAVERRFLFPTRIQYQKVSTDWLTACIPKISRPLEDSILRKVFADSCPLGTQQVRTGGIPVYFSRKVQNFLQVLDFVPKVYDGAGKLRPPSEFKEIDFPTEAEAALVFCVLNSALFLWFLNVFSDCRHVNKREVEGFRINLSKALRQRKQKWLDLSRSLSSRLQETSEFREMRFEHDRLRVQCILPKYAKDILDEIEHLLAEHFGLTDEELDFILNYNFKYRLGVSDLEEARV